MKRAYLLVYSDSLGSRDDIKKWANDSALVEAWRYDLPNSMYLVSEASAEKLSAEIDQLAGKRKRYIITEVSKNREGYLSLDTWYFLEHKTVKPKKA